MCWDPRRTESATAGLEARRRVEGTQTKTHRHPLEGEKGKAADLPSSLRKETQPENTLTGALSTQGDSAGRVVSPLSVPAAFYTLSNKNVFFVCSSVPITSALLIGVMLHLCCLDGFSSFCFFTFFYPLFLHILREVLIFYFHISNFIFHGVNYIPVTLFDFLVRLSYLTLSSCLIS